MNRFLRVRTRWKWCKAKLPRASIAPGHDAVDGKTKLNELDDVRYLLC